MPHKFAKEYTIQRKSNYWPMVIFSHLIDAKGIHFHKLRLLKYPHWFEHCLELGLSIV